jgi:hypothetical protein
VVRRKKLHPRITDEKYVAAAKMLYDEERHFGDRRRRLAKKAHTYRLGTGSVNWMSNVNDARSVARHNHRGRREELGKAVSPQADRAVQVILCFQTACNHPQRLQSKKCRI